MTYENPTIETAPEEEARELSPTELSEFREDVDGFLAGLESAIAELEGEMHRADRDAQPAMKIMLEELREEFSELKDSSEELGEQDFGADVSVKPYAGEA